MKLRFRDIFRFAACLLFAGGIHGYEIGSELPRPDKSGDLVQPTRFALSPVKFGEETRVVLFFYSASWCAPCKQAAAVLKEQYPKIRENAPRLQIITYSVDRTPRTRADYLRGGQYPWPALAPAVVEKAPWLPQIEGGTPQFQAFAVGNDRLTAITQPGPINEVIASLSQPR